MDVLVLFVAVAISRSVVRSHALYDIDSVNFALGLRRFDPAAHQPHPPGYFLYICLGRLMNVLCPDANTALVLLSIAASCATAMLLYRLTRDWFGRNAACCAGGLFLLSPLAWFHGTVALTYIVEAFFSTLVGYACWRVRRGAGKWAVPAAVSLGIAAGFRPSSLLFLAPLLAFSLPGVPRRRAAAAFAALSLTLLAWCLPMARQSGGVGAYLASFAALWTVAGGSATVFNSSPFVSIARICTIVGIGLVCFGPAVLWLARLPRLAAGRPLVAFTWVWITPGLLFFSFVFLRFVNSGYLLVISPPVFAWLGAAVADWCARRWRSWERAAAVGATLAVNLAVFLWAPGYYSHASVRRFEAELAAVTAALRGAASPCDTLIVGFDSHFLGYRHAGYYLPEYDVAQYPEVRQPAGPRVFFMHERNTRLAERLPAEAYRRFLLFPLPTADPEARQYLLKLQARFPALRLTRLVAGGREFLTAPIADLPILFPATAAAAAGVHSESRSLRDCKLP